jgi:ubiquinone/menaquinone biosynthesis C-methylase UbiE
MFNESSKYYDLIYGFKDYRRESAFLCSLIRRVAPDAGTLLDVACGTGEHIVSDRSKPASNNRN